MASFVAAGLRAEGYAVDHAATGAQAFARIQRGQPDLVVLSEGPVYAANGAKGTGTYATTLYTAPKGNLVFNAAYSSASIEKLLQIRARLLIAAELNG